MFALVADDLVTARLLLEQGAVVNACDKKRETALHKVLLFSKSETVRFLLERGADVNARDQDGNTPLHWAAIEKEDGQRWTEAAHLLIAHGADINRTNLEGETPLICAVRYGNAKGVKLLLAAHADPGIRNHEGYTALFEARRRLQGRRILTVA